MTPSKEAIEAAYKEYWHDNQVAAKFPEKIRWEKVIEQSYAIDVAPLEQKVKELEAENQRLKAQLEPKPLNAFACSVCGYVGFEEHRCGGTSPLSTPPPA